MFDHDIYIELSWMRRVGSPCVEKSDTFAPTASMRNKMKFVVFLSFCNYLDINISQRNDTLRAPIK